MEEDNSSEFSDSSSTEDEDAELLTPAAERQWLRAYAAVKLNDPAIYSKDSKFFHDKGADANDDEESDDGSAEEKVDSRSSKPVTVKDHERLMLIERGAQIADEEPSMPKVIPTKGYFEEQAELKKELLAALNDAEKSSKSDTNEPLIKLRRQKNDQQTDEYSEWLLKRRDSISDDGAVNQLEPLRQFWNDPNLDDAERYLRDYLLEKRYLPGSSNDTTFKQSAKQPEIQAEFPGKESQAEDGVESDRESNFSEKAEEFETKFNFRYEEPDATFMRRYPRTFATASAATNGATSSAAESGIIRKRAESKRAKKRREKSERQAVEKRAARNQLNRERASVRTDLRRRLDKIRDITGADRQKLQEVFGESDIDDETDFDPEKYEEKMKKLFGDDFYNGDEDDKPESLGSDVSDLESASEAQPKKKKSKKSGDVKQNLKRFAKESIKECKKYEEAIRKLEERERALEDGGVSLPYRYREVAPCDFGLTADEILRARDKELNAWVSNLRMVQYRTNEEEERDRRRYTSSGWQVRKTRIIPSLLEPVASDKPAKKRDDSASANDKAKKGGKKKQVKAKQQADSDADADAVAMEVDELQTEASNHAEEMDATSAVASKKKRKRKHKTKSLQPARKVEEKQKAADVPAVAEDRPEKIRSPKRAKLETEKEKEKEKEKDVGSDQVSQKVQKPKAKPKKKAKRSGVPKQAAAKDRPALSDARLRAYGIDPKKYKYLPLNKNQPSSVETH